MIMNFLIWEEVAHGTVEPGKTITENALGGTTEWVIFHVYSRNLK